MPLTIGTEALEEEGLDQPKTKNHKPVTLKIDEVPMLAVGSKPGKPGESEDASTPQSSVAPSIQDTPTKSLKEVTVSAHPYFLSPPLGNRIYKNRGTV